MRKTCVLPCLFISAVLIGGCSTLQPHADQAENDTSGSPESAARKHPPAPLPELELNGEMLFQYLVAEFASDQGEMGLAAATYLQLAQQTRDPRIARRATRVALFGRLYDIARQAAALWVELAPHEADARQSYAVLLIQAGEPDAAIEHMRELLVLQGPEEGFDILTKLLARADDSQWALAAMRSLAEPFGDNPHALYAQAHLATVAGDRDAALRLAERLLELQPESARALVIKADALYALGREEPALRSYREALELTPDDTNLRLGYARRLVDSGRIPAARKQFDRLAEQMPENADIVYAQGLLALQSGEEAAAEEHFRRLLELGLRRDEALFALGQLADQQGEDEAAIDWYRRIEDGERYLDAQLRIAVIKAERDGADAGLSHLQRIEVEGEADRVRLLQAQGEVLRSVSRHEEAMALYDEALERFPGNQELLYARAMTAEQIDRLDLLERDLRAILEQDPDDAQALNALGYTLADRTHRYQEALDLIERALELEPKDPAVLDSMGWVLYKLGRYDEALEHLQRAMNLVRDGEIAAHYGEVLWVTGQRDDAREVWERALEFAPDNEILQRTRERFLR